MTGFFKTYFSQVFHFCTAWKRQETFGSSTFSGVAEMEHWAANGLTDGRKDERTYNVIVIIFGLTSVSRMHELAGDLSVCV